MLAKVEGKTRNTPVRLSNKEKYIVYKHAVENRCIVQDGAEFEFRVPAMKIAKEINNVDGLLPKTINSHHVLQAIEEIIEWQQMMNNLPVPQETGELEQVRIELNNARTTRDNYKQELGSYKDEVTRLNKKLEQTDAALVRKLQNKLEKIKQALID